MEFASTGIQLTFHRHVINKQAARSLSQQNIPGQFTPRPPNSPHSAVHTIFLCSRNHPYHFLNTLPSSTELAFWLSLNGVWIFPGTQQTPPSLSSDDLHERTFRSIPRDELVSAFFSRAMSSPRVMRADRRQGRSYFTPGSACRNPATSVAFSGCRV